MAGQLHAPVARTGREILMRLMMILYSSAVTFLRAPKLFSRSCNVSNNGRFKCFNFILRLNDINVLKKFYLFGFEIFSSCDKNR